jgi:hypothetical protein
MSDFSNTSIDLAKLLEYEEKMVGKLKKILNSF